MNLLTGIISIVAALGVSSWLARRFSNPASRLQILDYPNARSLHAQPTSRAGGIAILGGVVVGMLMLVSRAPWSNDYLWIGAALATVAGISLWDDLYGSDVAIRLCLHIGGTLFVLQTGVGVNANVLPSLGLAFPAWLSLSLAVVFLLWMINLYNFMDGMDGLAAGMAVFGFTFFAVLSWQAHLYSFAFASCIVAAASLGFLIFNFAPARIFMGDVGSASLGLLAGVFSIAGAQLGAFPLWAAILIFSPFIVDATVTLVRRLFRGEAVWQAHRTHYYQRLVQMGWGHRKTALYAYGLMAACGVSAVIAVRLAPAGQWSVLGAWLVIYTVIARWIDARAH